MRLIKGEVGFGRFYYGWVIVGVALVSMAFWFGIRTAFSVFYVALLEDFPWGRGEAAGVQSLTLITYTIMAPLVGWLIDRFGPRRIMVPGIVLLALGLILCSSIKTLLQFYLLYGVLVGIGITCTAILPYSAILAHWFEKRKGVASGLALSGMGLGVFVLVPLSQYFISLWGWRLAFAALGVLVLIFLLPLNALFLRHRPEQLGLSPDGARGPGPSKGPRLEVIDRAWSETDWTLRNASRTGKFWALMIFPFCVAIPIFIVIVHGVRFLVDQGIDKMTAAFVLALVGIVSSVFRILWGWLSDSIGRENTYTLGVICMCVGLCSLILLEILGERRFVYPFIVFFSAGWGATTPMFVSVSADLFRGKGFGLIFGTVEGVIGIGCALGAWVAGFIFDKTQSYQMAFVLATTLSIASCLFIWLAAPRKVLGIGK